MKAFSHLNAYVNIALDDADVFDQTLPRSPYDSRPGEVEVQVHSVHALCGQMLGADPWGIEIRGMVRKKDGEPGKVARSARLPFANLPKPLQEAVLDGIARLDIPSIPDEWVA